MSSTTFWYATRASGIMALVLLTATMVLGLVTTNRARARGWPGFAQQELHRRISMLSMVFLGIHVLTSVLDTYVSIGWAAVVVPFISPYSPFWIGLGTISLDLMVAVFITSILHWLAYVCWPIALAHTFGMGTDSGEPWVIGLGVACVASVGVAFLWKLRVTARQRELRARHAPVDLRSKHLVLSGPTEKGTGRA
jgi:hypothetical protein